MAPVDTEWQQGQRQAVAAFHTYQKWGDILGAADRFQPGQEEAPGLVERGGGDFFQLRPDLQGRLRAVVNAQNIAFIAQAFPGGP